VVSAIRRWRLCVLPCLERHDDVTTSKPEVFAVREAARDDAWDAVVALEQRCGQRLYGYALRRGVGTGLAGDIVQEALLRLWRELRRGAVIESHEAWTFRTVSRLAVDAHRLHRRIIGLTARLADRIPPRVLEIDATVRVAVWTQVDRLPDRQRQVVYLRHRGDLTFEEIGQVMGITPGAARTHMAAALKTLRDRLGMDGTGP
jgi:RNA polymerase sigma-70 factor (ECF subfamily)